MIFSIFAKGSESFLYDKPCTNLNPRLGLKWALSNVPILRKLAASKHRLLMQGEIASEVRCPSRGEPPRLYFGDDPKPRVARSSKDDQSTLRQLLRSPHSLLRDGLIRISLAARATFLPAGYPSSVPPEYLKFQLWNILQDLTSSLRSILATQKILEGMGVGRAGVTSLVATMQVASTKRISSNSTVTR